MHFHPIDTYEAFKPSNKQYIAHLSYHLDYNQTMEKGDNNFKRKKIEPLKVAHNDLKNLAKYAEEERSKALAKANGYLTVRQLKGEITNRIIAGLGSGHVQETALTIHPVYGFPFVPASSLKGLVRNWFIHAYCEGDEKKLADHPEGALIFGTNSQKGFVQFYDLFLYDRLQIEGDIMAVHFQKYYSEKCAATDDQRINPLSFWTVKVRKVNIFLSVEKNRLNMKSKAEELKLLDAAVSWTAQALQEFGIGAKTSLGYGVFSSVKDVTVTEFQKFLKQQEEEKKLEESRKIEEKLNRMSPEDRLVYQIKQLENNHLDIDKSKGEIYRQVVDLNSRKAALALKEYWQNTEQWKVKKGKKQYEKVNKLKQILE